MLNLSNLSLLLLIGHFLGDFHLQSQELAEAKESQARGLIIHLLIHAVLLIVIAFVIDRQFYFQLGLVLIVHIALDSGKFLIGRLDWSISKAWLYVIDQALHLLVILMVGQDPQLLTISPRFGWMTIDLLKWTLLIILITKPANVTFKIMFERYQNYQGSDLKAVTVPGAGAVIGNLERILSAIFLSMNAIGSIGLIYTAKSIARFKEIEENKGFAEYYLIGTLYSILFVIGAYLLVV